MDPRPPNLLLLLVSLLCLWRSGVGQNSFTIDEVGLIIQPGNRVQSGTPVTLYCNVVISHGSSFHQEANLFEITQDDVAIHFSNTTQNFVMYEIDAARAADSGTYECRVKIGSKNRISNQQKLNVTGLQSPILWLSTTKPYDNQEFKAICTAPDEKGPFIFHFYQRPNTGQPSLLKQILSTVNSSETKLVLRKVGNSYLYCSYDITLISGKRSSEHSNEVEVIVRALFIVPTMSVQTQPVVYEGDEITVDCWVTVDLQDVEVFLTKDRKVLKQGKVKLHHKFRVQEGDSGELVCKAEWGNVQKETYESISVKSLFSQPTLAMEPQDVFERDNFKLTCSVSIYVPEKIKNENVSFSIYKDNVKVSNAGSYLIMAKPLTNGNYTCKAQASSYTHTFVKESQMCIVQAKVPVSEPVLSVVGGTMVFGRPFQLQCQSDIGTLPITYKLYGPNGTPQQKVVSKPGQQAIFNTSGIYKISEVKELICKASNNKYPRTGMGQQLLRSTKFIEPVSKPDLSAMPYTGDVSEGEELSLVCAVQRGTPPVSFTWFQVENEKPLHSQKSEQLRETYRVQNVKADDKGGYYCVSSNPANETKQSAVVMVRVKLASWKKALIAVFCILLILALILVIAIKRGMIRCKRKRAGELSVKSAGTKVERLSLTQAEVNDGANVTPGMMGKSVWSEHVSGSESDDQNSVASPESRNLEYAEVQTRRADPNRVPEKGTGTVYSEVRHSKQLPEKGTDNVYSEVPNSKQLPEKGTDTVYSEVRNSKQLPERDPDAMYSEVRNSKHGVPQQPDGGSVEYAQLNHDTVHHGNHDDHGIQDDHLDEIADFVTADQGE